MDVSVHDVEEIRMKRKMLSGLNVEVLKIYIENDIETHEVVLFSDIGESITLDFRGIGFE